MFASLEEQRKVDDATTASPRQRMTKWAVIAFVADSVGCTTRSKRLPDQRLRLPPARVNEALLDRRIRRVGLCALPKRDARKCVLHALQTIVRNVHGATLSHRLAPAG